MLYPILKDCETQPLVTVSNIVLRNLTSKNGLLYPGLIRCNASNPCTNIVFEDVQYTGLLKNLGYIC